MKPILFNTEMVRAILEGRKTATRRVVKPRYRDDEAGFQVLANKQTGEFIRVEKVDENECGIFYDGTERVVCPPYSTGDILWVRETFFREECLPDCAGQSDPDECPFNRVGDSCYGYKTQYIDSTGKIRWRPSIHMPREAARLFLRVTDVRVERLLEMSRDDAVAEGVNPTLKDIAPDLGYYRVWHEMQSIWDSTIQKDKLQLYGWDANPWVWVIEFERINKEEAEGK